MKYSINSGDLLLIPTWCSDSEGQLKITFRPEIAVLTLDDSAI
jgi:hypothetical protein